MEFQRVVRKPRAAAVAALAAILGAFAPLSSPSAATRAVPQDYASLRAALEAAVAGDSVVVGAGVYAERALRLPGGVTLRGVPGVTVIVDAGGEGRHLDVEAGGETVIESLVFQAGSTPRGDPDGGSLRAAAKALLTVRDCVFDSTSALHSGGAIHCAAGVSLTLERCSFARSKAYQKLMANQARRKLQSLSATSNGGTLYMDRGSRLVATECRFSDSHAKDWGGAIYLGDGATARLTDCSFRGATALSGAVIAGEHADVRLERCDLRGGVSTQTFREPAVGGAIRLAGGGELAVVDCSFIDNRADQGGAIAVTDLDGVKITGSRFLRNFSAGGGALYAGISPLTIEETVFAANNAGPGNGGAILAGGGPVTIRRSTFHGNAAGRGGSALDISGPVATRLDGCILAAGKGSGPIGRMSGPVIELSCCNIHGNEAGDWVDDLATMAGRNGNLSVDPGFRNPGSGDFTLEEGSPCRDADGCGRIGAEGAAAP